VSRQLSESLMFKIILDTNTKEPILCPDDVTSTMFAVHLFTGVCFSDKIAFYFDSTFDRTCWRLFQKDVVFTKLDI